MKKENLKIDLRAVPFGTSDNHVLEYRISPDQDLKYYKEHRWLWGLIKFRTVAKYSTKWIQPVRFFNCLTSYRYNENDSFSNDHPIFVRSKEALEKFKTMFQTYGQFMDWYWEEDAKQRSEYRKKREEYLEKMSIWE